MVERLTSIQEVLISVPSGSKKQKHVERGVWVLAGRERVTALGGAERQIKAVRGLWKVRELSGDVGCFWERVDDYEGG